jgi:hypothetical protein
MKIYAGVKVQKFSFLSSVLDGAFPTGWTVWGVGLRSLNLEDCGLESYRGGGGGCLFLLSIVCCQEKLSAPGWSLFQRSPTECGVSHWNYKALIMGRPWTTRSCWAGGWEGRGWQDRSKWSVPRSGRCISGERTTRIIGDPHKSRTGSFGERKSSWLDRKLNQNPSVI